MGGKQANTTALRPPVSVVVPFAGTLAEAEATLEALAAIRRNDPDDEIVVADNSLHQVVAGARGADAVEVIAATGERSSYYARNEGASRARNPWLLFLDADCRPDAEILDAFFAQPPDERVGALAGEIVGDLTQSAVTARYSLEKGQLDQARAVAHPFRPHAVTANLLVRREAWRSIGGFLEGIRSGGDTDFTWRLQEAGWSLVYRGEARVVHRNRERFRPFFRVALRYAAGRAWLNRRYENAMPDGASVPALLRATASTVWWTATGRRTRGLFRGLDAAVIAADLAGRFLPNTPPAQPVQSADLAVLTDTFPSLTETFIVNELAALAALGVRLRVEALRRPVRQDRSAAREFSRAYQEDDSRLRKIVDLAWLVSRHPLACARDLRSRPRWRREEQVRPLRAIAPVARRLTRAGEPRVHAHFATESALTAMRLGALLGIQYSVTAHAYDIFREPRNLREKLERADVVTTGCRYNVDHLRTLVAAETRDRIHEIVMGVDGEVFRRREAYPGGGIILAVGRLVAKKGFGDLVEAASVLKPRGVIDRVVIVGDGPLRSELETSITRHDLTADVELTGALEHQLVRDLLERASVLVMPCVVAEDGDRDSMPVVVKEALAMEVPVVATDEVGLPELVQPGWGRLVPPHDASALAEAIAELLELSVEERRDMGRRGREFVLTHCNVRREAVLLAGLLRLSARL